MRGMRKKKEKRIPLIKGKSAHNLNTINLLEIISQTLKIKIKREKMQLKPGMK